MSKEQRVLIDSLTPENRSILLVLQLHMGRYMDGEIEICRQVSILRHGDNEYLCPMQNPSIYKGINTRPLKLDENGDVRLSIEGVPLNGASLAGQLDIMVGSVNLFNGMRVGNPLHQLGEGIALPAGGRDARAFRTVTVGEMMEGLTDRSDVVISLDRHPRRQSPNRSHGESEVCYRPGIDLSAYALNDEQMAELLCIDLPESRSAAGAILSASAPLNESEYFNRKMRIPGYEAYASRTIVPRGFWARVGYKWGMFKERVAESRIGQFFSNAFKR